MTASMMCAIAWPVWVGYSLAVAGLLLLSAACTITSRSETFLASDVDLAVSTQTTAVAGESVPVMISVRNLKGSRIRGCIGSGRITHLWGLDNRFDHVISSVPDHATCYGQFKLESGSVDTWQERVILPDGPPGRAKLIVFVQLVAVGAKCDNLGCDVLWVHASSAPIDITGPAKR